MAELEFKYLNEIDISSSLTDSAHVIVEDGGSIKRAPMNQLVVEGGVSSWNDLEDKPFGEEGTGTTIEWDGSAEGRESALLNETTIYKVSDLVPSLDELKGCTATISAGGDPVEIPEEHIIVGEGCIVVAQLIVVVSATEYKLPGDNENVYSAPSVGTYAAIMQNKYIKSLTYGSTTIKPLDEKFIPDTIARVSDVVTSVNGMTGNVVIEGGGASNWNDLGYNYLTLTWDGSVEGREFFTNDNMFNYYKISDTYIPAEQFIGGVIEVSGADALGIPSEIQISEELILGSENGVSSIGFLFPLICSFTPEFVANEEELSSLSGGTYILLAKADVLTEMLPEAAENGIVFKEDLFASKLKVVDGVNLIPEEFLPEINALPEVTAENNGNVLTVVDGEWNIGQIEIPEVNYPVTSVNGQTGAVIIEIPEINYPVTSVNGQTGAVVIDIPEVNYPVTSVNGQTGEVIVEIPVTSVNGQTGAVSVEIPTKLSNPNAITFTGAVEATYDGSSAVSVEIPVAEKELPEATTDNNGAFLRIVDGAPTWVMLEIAEEGAY